MKKKQFFPVFLLFHKKSSSLGGLSISMSSSGRPIIIAPSILSANFAELAAECSTTNASWLHVDVMDAHFVPNLTIGPSVIKSLRQHPLVPRTQYLDVHLMISDPRRWIPEYIAAGSNGITFHIEAVSTLDEAVDCLTMIKAAGCRAGITLRPGTPIESILPLLERQTSGNRSLVDMVLVMTVEPGFGGQAFMAAQLSKVRCIRQRYPDLWIEVDGGITSSTIGAAASAGANVFVAGTAVFGYRDRPAAMARLVEAAAAGVREAPPPSKL